MTRMGADDPELREWDDRRGRRSHTRKETRSPSAARLAPVPHPERGTPDVGGSPQMAQMAQMIGCGRVLS